ncbi:hypothetical protein C8A00DRAFT_14117 [Chaetomidium leptoderma]|uniref:Pheromone-regulated membrane protein n=1 Tax=Chaetomidium leptoderma TaxID=669021 RepID=A0AAN6VNB4_9PEZI|nr:hypothetical protein C8A00DRAFT_14117 [Chaetomidium leptoderma]
MGFLSHRRRDIEVKPEQKWDFISLNDFKSTSFFAPLAYGYLWFTLIIALAVYAVDVFTAYQLLAFDKWSSQIEPAQFIPFDISKWIFTVCIILSFVNLAYEYLRAVAIMRRGSVAECFLDSLAARLECVRMGSGRGWKRFLVFAELTKSKKGAEYIALFTFFNFQSWIRTILCSGPRQAINALTLYSVYNAKLQISQDSFEASLADFFDKIRALATEETRQAVILSGMLFTLVIWVFSFLSLLLAALFFIFFLWNYIPREDGGLTGFCERKVNKRLKQIVSIKINKAMAEDERKRKKAELREAKKNGGDRPMTMKPSLPVLDDNLPGMPTLSRADTFASYSEKPSRPNTPGSFEMNALGGRPPMPLRSETNATTSSQYSAKAPLLDSAAGMGMTRSELPTPTLPPLDSGSYPPSRTATSASNRSYGPGPQPQRMASNGSSLRAGYTASPAPYPSETMPSLPAPVMSPVGPYNSYQGSGPNQPRGRLPHPSDNRSTFDDYSSGRASPAPNQPRDRLPYPGDNRPPFDDYSGGRASPAPTLPRLQPFDDYSSGRASPAPTLPRLQHPGDNRSPFDDYSSGRASPAPSTTTYRSNPMSPRGMGPDGYPNPIRSATNPMPPRGAPQFPPPRAMTQAMTQPMSPANEPTDSNGPLRGLPSAPRPYQAYHQPSASNSSLRNMVNAVSYEEADNRSDYGSESRSNPTQGNNLRGPPRGGNGWNQDLERGGSRY